MLDEIWSQGQELFGRSLAGLNVVLPEIMPICFLIIILLAAFSMSKKEPYLGGKQRLIFLAIGIIEVILIYVGMMIGWTTYGNVRIGGVQGRYMIPLLLPIMAGIGNNSVKVYLSDRSLWFAYFFTEVTEIILVCNLVYFPV